MNRWLLITGAALFTTSLPFLIMMLLEALFSHRAHEQYRIKDYRINVREPTRIVYGAHEVLVEIPEREDHTSESGLGSIYRITIDERDYSWHLPLEAREALLDSDRLPLAIVEFMEADSREEFLAVIEVGIDESGGMIYRIIKVDPSGPISEERFRFSERTFPFYRSMAVNLVSEKDVGVYSGVLSAWPSLLYPVLYPFGTAIVGVILVIIWLATKRP